jgi:DNA-binding response OmpR family regulator
MPTRTQPRLLLIDDDPLFGGALHHRAEARGLALDYRESLVEALYESYLESYDAAIVDCCLPEADGFEIAQYLGTFLRGLPVVLVSAADGPYRRFLEGGTGARAFVSKRQGGDAILAAATRVIAR